jgi:hypothetical protein
MLRAESQFVKTSCTSKVDFCPFRGPDAPFALRQCYHRASSALVLQHEL